MSGRQVMVQFEDARGALPGLVDAAEKLGVEPEDLDAEYGVVKVADDPDRTIWVVRADEDVARTISQGPATSPGSTGSGDTGAQVFSDPVIEAFGPPQ
jgi:hypothetical protein